MSIGFQEIGRLGHLCSWEIAVCIGVLGGHEICEGSHEIGAFHAGGAIYKFGGLT